MNTWDRTTLACIPMSRAPQTGCQKMMVAHATVFHRTTGDDLVSIKGFEFLVPLMPHQLFNPNREDVIPEPSVGVPLVMANTTGPEPPPVHRTLADV